MSNQNKMKSDEAGTEAPETKASETAAEEIAETEVPAPEAGDNDEVTALKSELAAMKDRALRAVAEAENVRRRADKERRDTLKYATAGLARELLPVVDNLRRAVESVPREAKEGSAVLKNLMVGVEMTEKMLLDAFGKHAIAKVDPLDERFNHAEHQAMQEIPGTGKPVGTVVQVLQPGYKLHDRLLRPAMVVLAKGESIPPPEDSEKVDTTT